MTSQDRIESVYAAKGNAELEARYDDWAAEYDQDLGTDAVWISPRIAVARLAEHVDIGSTILDAGAGTGLVGERLAAAGYRDLVAIDLSPGMLAAARAKGVYRELRQMTLGQPLAFADAAFDAVIAVGVFTTGHAPARAFDELIRVTRPEGAIVFSLRMDRIEPSFTDRLAQLEANRHWRLVERTEPFRPLPEAEPEVLHRVWMYRVTG